MKNNGNELLKECIRQIIKEELLEEAWIIDKLKDLFGIPRATSVSDMTPSGRYTNLVKVMNLSGLQNNYDTLFKAFLDAGGWGRRDQHVQQIMRSVRDRITTELTQHSISMPVAMGFATEFIKSAENRAHKQMLANDEKFQKEIERNDRKN